MKTTLHQPHLQVPFTCLHSQNPKHPKQKTHVKKTKLIKQTPVTEILIKLYLYEVQMLQVNSPVNKPIGYKITYL